MTQLESLETLLFPNGAQVDQRNLLEIYLDFASDIICDLRNASYVENEYLNVQLKIAVELYNKNGAEGQIAHGENGISRSYGKSEVSEGLLNQIVPFVKTPYSIKRVIA